jgi:putative pyruvate formate lyase activating enzyme
MVALLKATIPTSSRGRPVTYVALYQSGELQARAEKAWSRLRRCSLCPRRCLVDRLADGLGECRTGAPARIASYGPHFGEEAPLVGRGGSGTIFFAGCNLACVFCQNHDISQPAGDPASTVTRPASVATPCSLRWEGTPERLAELMLGLQAAGCENINFVSPSHVVPQILAALVLATQAGLRLPLVYNTGGYDSVATLRLLDGVIDIYMPDMKYADERVGERLCGAPDYPRRNRRAVLEMHRQVGDLELDERGVARRGLLVRHLVLPGGLAGTAKVARFLADEISPDTYVNVMDQYRPAHRTSLYPDISRPATGAEYREAVRATRAAGLWRLDTPMVTLP